MGQIILLLVVAIVFYFIGVHESSAKLKRANSTLDDMYAMNDRIIARALSLQSRVSELEAELITVKAMGK